MNQVTTLAPCNPPRPRRWIPLSLRMYVAVLVIAGVASAVNIGLPAWRQHIALKEIERLGGFAIAAPGGPAWLRAVLGNDRMKMFDDVVYVELGRTRASDSTLRHLSCLTSISGLSLGGTEITDAGLGHLEKLTNLHNLVLVNTRVTDAGLAHLTELKRLRYLVLDRTDVTDAGLVPLEELTSLKDLSLGSTRVSDASLVHLAALTRLEYLWLRDTLVTDAGAVELQAALPNAKIVH
jgi:hypothetical protein